MTNLVSALIRHGFVYPNPSSCRSFTPLIVPKPGPARLRFAVDLRLVNRFTTRHQYPMPIPKQELTELAGSSFYANFDFVHSYWQLTLHTKSQMFQSLMTPAGVYSPTRVLRGTTNAVTHLPSSLTLTIPQELKPNILLWLDDCSFIVHLTQIFCSV